MNGAGAAPIWSEPESAPGPRTYGAAKNIGGTATLVYGNCTRSVFVVDDYQGWTEWLQPSVLFNKIWSTPPPPPAVGKNKPAYL